MEYGLILPMSHAVPTDDIEQIHSLIDEFVSTH